MATAGSPSSQFRRTSASDSTVSSWSSMYLCASCGMRTVRRAATSPGSAMSRLCRGRTARAAARVLPSWIRSATSSPASGSTSRTTMPGRAHHGPRAERHGRTPGSASLFRFRPARRRSRSSFRATTTFSLVCNARYRFAAGRYYTPVRPVDDGPALPFWLMEPWP